MRAAQAHEEARRRLASGNVSADDGCSGAAAFVAIEAALGAVDACRRAVPDGVSPTTVTYLEGAFGSLLHARDVLRRAVSPDGGGRWRAELPGLGIVQSGDAGKRLTAAELDDCIVTPARPDLGADLVRSSRMAGLAERAPFSAMLASALAEHRWLHLASAASWTASWPAADALVRAVNGGRDVVRVDHLAMRGTLDEEVARELAALGWRRISSPALPGTA